MEFVTGQLLIYLLFLIDPSSLMLFSLEVQPESTKSCQAYIFTLPTSCISFYGNGRRDFNRKICFSFQKCLLAISNAFVPWLLRQYY